MKLKHTDFAIYIYIYIYIPMNCGYYLYMVVLKVFKFSVVEVESKCAKISKAVC